MRIFLLINLLPAVQIYVSFTSYSQITFSYLLTNTSMVYVPLQLINKTKPGVLGWVANTKNMEKKRDKKELLVLLEAVLHTQWLLKKYRRDLNELMITYRVEAFQLIYVILWVAC